MSQASLSGLAPELKIQIFKSMDNFSSVVKLSSTSRTFHNIWKSNTRVVCDAVLDRSIECPLEAKKLFDAQESSQHAVVSRTVVVQDLKNGGEEHKSFDPAIVRSMQILDNAFAASWALRVFSHEASYKPTYHPTSGRGLLGRGLSPAEEIHFVQAYYRAMTMVLLSREGILESSIASWDMLEFQRVREVLAFLFKDCSR